MKILSGLDDSLSLDHTKKWNKISNHVSKDIMPAINQALTGRMLYKQTELKFVLQQLHRHRRENWTITQDDAKLKMNRKRKGTNSRRADVSIIGNKTYRIAYYYFIYYFHFTLRKRKKKSEVSCTCTIRTTKY